MAKNKTSQEPQITTIETFGPPGRWEINRMIQKDEPYCINGHAFATKYRVTIEPIDEPLDVQEARVQKMWDECDNRHHWEAIEAVAKSINYQLQGSPGSRRKN